MSDSDLSKRVNLATVIAVRRGPLSAQLSRSALDSRVFRAVYPIHLQLGLKGQLLRDSPSYSQIANYLVTVASPQALSYVRDYLGDCMKQLNGVLIDPDSHS